MPIRSKSVNLSMTETARINGSTSSCPWRDPGGCGCAVATAPRSIGSRVLYAIRVWSDCSRTHPQKGLSEFKEWRAQVNQETLILLLDGIEDPRNVGACLRTAAAAGVDGVIMPAKTGAGLTPAALRVAEGGIHQLNVFELESWTHVLKKT